MIFCSIFGLLPKIYKNKQIYEFFHEAVTYKFVSFNVSNFMPKLNLMFMYQKFIYPKFQFFNSIKQ